MNFNFVQKAKLHTLPSLCTFTHSPTAMNDGETIETMNQLFQNSEPTHAKTMASEKRGTDVRLDKIRYVTSKFMVVGTLEALPAQR